MKPSDYEFAVGDKVVTIFGDVGYVIDICECKKCVERGFHELKWKLDDGIDGIDLDWVTIYDAESGFNDFYQIGKYRFGHKFDKDFLRQMIIEKETELTRYKRHLEIIDVLEKEDCNENH